MQKALDFLRYHNEVAFATSDGHLPKIRIFQIMKQEGVIRVEGRHIHILSPLLIS